MSFQRTLLKNFSIIAFFRYSSNVISFLGSMVIARLISPEEFGVFVLLAIFSNFAIMFLDSGITAATIRTNKDDRHIENIHYFMILVGTFFTLALLLLTYPIVLFYDNIEFILPYVLLALTIFFHALTIVPQAKLSKEFKFKTVGISVVIKTVITVGLTIGFAFFGLSYYALIIPLILAPFVQFMFLNKYTKFSFKLLKKPDFKEVFTELKPLLINVSGFTFFNYWARNLDKLLAGKLFGESNAGIYNRAYSLLTLPLQMLTGVFNSVQLPTFNKLLKEEKDITSEYVNSLNLLSFVIFPVSILLIHFSDQVTLVLWGAQWKDVAQFLPIIAILLPLQVIASTSGEMFILRKKEKRLATIGILNALIMIVAIVLGAQENVFSIMTYYAFAYIFVAFPVLTLFGFYKIFNFSAFQLLYSIVILWGILAAFYFNFTLNLNLLYEISICYIAYSLFQLVLIIRSLKSQ